MEKMYYGMLDYFAVRELVGICLPTCSIYIALQLLLVLHTDRINPSNFVGGRVNFGSDRI